MRVPPFHWLLLVTSLALWGCKSAPVAKPNGPDFHSRSHADTSEVPYQGVGPGLAPPSVVSPAAASWSAKGALAKALALESAGSRVQAEAELTSATRDPAAAPYAWTDLGVLFERDGQPARAEEAYKKALALEPDAPAAWDYLTRLYCRLGRASEAELLLRSNVQSHPGSLGMRNALVFALLYQGQLEPAGLEAKKVLKADERNTRAMQLLARVYYRQQKYELARLVLENARAVDGADAATQNSLGLVQLALKNRPAALESFQKAASLRPDFAEAKNNYGAMLNDAQDYDGAVRALSAAVQAAPDFVAARVNLGNAYRGKQELDKALEQYQAAARLAPSMADTYFNLAILHLDSELPKQDPVERFKAAIAYFNEYRAKGGTDDRVDQYIKDANKGIDRELRRRERERKEQLRKAQKQAEVPPSAPSKGPNAKSGGPPGKSAPSSGRLAGDEK